MARDSVGHLPPLSGGRSQHQIICHRKENGWARAGADRHWHRTVCPFPPTPTPNPLGNSNPLQIDFRPLTVLTSSRSALLASAAGRRADLVSKCRRGIVKQPAAPSRCTPSIVWKSCHLANPPPTEISIDGALRYALALSSIWGG